MPVTASVVRKSIAAKSKFVVLGAGAAIGVYAAVGGVGYAASPPPVASVFTTMPQYVLVDSVAFTDSTHLNKAVGGVHGIPTDATAVTLNLTVQNGVNTGALYVFPGLTAQPTVPVLQWQPAQNTTGSITAALGTNGHLMMQSTGENFLLTATITGYYSPAGGASGPAGGVLTGTYPNPGLAANAVAASNINSSGSTQAGQLLTSTATGTQWQTPNYQGAFTNTKVVHATSDPVASGSALLAAIAGLPNQRNVVVVEPGNYDVGTTVLTLPANTWLQGSGAAVTSIYGSGLPTKPIVMAGSNTGISNIAITDTGGAYFALEIPSVGSLTVDQATLTANGIDNNTLTVAVDDEGSLTMQDSTVVDSGAGGFDDGLLIRGSGTTNLLEDTINVSGSTTSGLYTGLHILGVTGRVTVRGTTISAVSSGAQTADGIEGENSSAVTINGSQISGTTHGVSEISGLFNIGGSQLSGGVVKTGGAVNCGDVYSASLVPLNLTCS